MSVMRRWTISTVENLTLFDKERENDNKKRTGYRVYISRYCVKFRKLDSVQHQNIIRVPNNINKEEEEVAEDVDNNANNNDITVHGPSMPTNYAQPRGSGGPLESTNLDSLISKRQVQGMTRKGIRSLGGDC